MDKETIGKFDIISGQIKCFYLKVRTMSSNQEVIYYRLAEWLNSITKKGSLEACKVIVAFFIQNCEVFSSAPKQSN